MSLDILTVEKVLKSFRDEMGERPDLMIVGSLSLYLNGFDVEVNDIDLEYYDPSPQNLEKLDLFERISPSGIKNYSVDEDKRYDFMYRGVKFNVWIKRVTESLEVVAVKDVRRYTFWNYYKVSNVVSTIRAMREQGRIKDFRNILKLVNQISIH